MADLRERFRSLDGLEVPDLRREIRDGPRVSAPPPKLAGRLVAAIVALTVAAAGVLVAVRAFSGDPRPPDLAAGSTPQNGKIAFVRRDGEIWLANPDGGDQRRLTDVSDVYDSPAWSPDGTKIAFSRGAAGLFVMDADGTNLSRVLADYTGPTSPSWSPDGVKIAFDSGKGEESRDIWVIGVDGSGLHRLTDDKAWDGQPSWSPDGARIAFIRYRSPSDTDILVMDADGSNVAALTNGERTDFFPQWSPDGQEIAFRGDDDIYVMRADGSDVRRLTYEGVGTYENGLTWSPDGSQLLFADSEGRFYTMAPDGTDLRRIPGIEGGSPAWQPFVPEADTPGAAEIPQVDPRVTETVDVGAFPRSIAFGEGSVWVGVSAQGPGNDPILARLDPRSNEVVGRIPLAQSFESIAAGEGGVWVDSYRGTEPPYEPTLLRIDPLTESVAAEVPGVHGPLEIAAGSLWAFEGGPDAPWFLVRLHPGTYEVLARIAIPEPAWNVVAGDGAIWVLTFEEQLLMKIDPLTNRVVFSVQLPGRTHNGSSYAPVVTDGVVWVPGSTLHDIVALRFDTETGESLGEPIPIRGSAGIGAYGGRVWFLAEDGAAYGVNTGTLETDASVRFEWPASTATEPSAAIDPLTGTIWVANYRDTVTRIDLVS